MSSKRKSPEAPGPGPRRPFKGYEIPSGGDITGVRLIELVDQFFSTGATAMLEQVENAGAEKGAIKVGILLFRLPIRAEDAAELFATILTTLDQAGNIDGDLLEEALSTVREAPWSNTGPQNF